VGERLRQMQQDQDRIARGLEHSAAEREQLMRDAERTVMRRGVWDTPRAGRAGLWRAVGAEFHRPCDRVDASN
jgi:hypothetical protein